jgi:hypothetical protein
LGGCTLGIGERIASNLTKTVLAFERFFPQFVRFSLNRRLKEAKKRGVITNYKVKAIRKAKYHYVFEIDLYLKA